MKSLLISCKSISTCRLFLTEVVSAFTRKLPEGLHSILTSSLADNWCSITHLFGKLTMYVEPPVS